MVVQIARLILVISVRLNYYNSHFVTNVKKNAENALILIPTQSVQNVQMGTLFKITIAFNAAKIANTVHHFKFVLSVL